jgi:hypothetical protein
MTVQTKKATLESLRIIGTQSTNNNYSKRKVSFKKTRALIDAFKNKQKSLYK